MIHLEEDDVVYDENLAQRIAEVFSNGAHLVTNYATRRAGNTFTLSMYYNNCLKCFSQINVIFILYVVHTTHTEHVKYTNNYFYYR